MSLLTLAALLVLLACMVMALAWLIAEQTGQSGWADAVWSFLVGGLGVLAGVLPLDAGNPWTTRQVLVSILAALWSVRLGGHIALRTRRGGDDPRYTELRKEWGGNAPLRLYWFLQIQAAAALVLALCIGLAARNPVPGMRVLDWLGVVLIVMAIAGEGIADGQMQRFRADPANKGKVCDRGLWGLSRHPNYFFEWLGWLSYAVIAADPGGSHSWGWVAILGPAMMYVLLVHVSGIPPLEAHMLRSRGSAFRDYQRRVGAFWPWPARSGILNVL